MLSPQETERIREFWPQYDEGLGILLLRVRIQFGYIGDIGIQAICHLDNDEGKEAETIYDAFKLAEQEKDVIACDDGIAVKNLLNRYILRQQNGKDLYPYGYPIVGKIEDLNKITMLETTYTISEKGKNKKKLESTFYTPLHIQLTEDKPYASVEMDLVVEDSGYYMMIAHNGNHPKEKIYQCSYHEQKGDNFFAEYDSKGAYEVKGIKHYDKIITHD